MGLMAISQTYTVSVSGTVTDQSSGSPVANQEIYIWTDSINSGGTGYYNTVYTDSNGHYSDSFTEPSNTVGNVDISTYSCGSYITFTYAYSQNMTQIVADIEVCSDSTGNCQALYSYYIVSGNTVQFNDLSIGDPAAWTWDFGDGNSSSNQNPEHTYANSGTYLVSLFIQDNMGQCASIYENIVNVNDSTWPSDCEANFYYLQENNDHLTVNFTDISYTNNQAVNWNWDFGDGQYSTEQNPTHTYPHEGNYQVCLTIYDSISNCEDATCIIIDVVNNCNAAFIYYPMDTMNNGGYNPGLIQFIDISFGTIDTWNWDFGDGQTSTEQNPVHNYSDSGAYQVCLTISNPADSCISSYCEMVYVNDTLPGGCYSYFTSEILDLTVNLEATVVGGDGTTEFSWVFSDGTTGYGPTISHTFSTSGMYDIILTTQDSSGCVSTYQEILWVGELTMNVNGFVYLDNNSMADYANVYLMTLDTINYGLINVDTTQIDSSGFYEFQSLGIENCIYFIQAELTDQSAYVGQYMPTYHLDAMNWEYAWPILPFQTGYSTDVIMLNISSSNGGNGLITGTVSEETSRGRMATVEVVLLNSENEPVYYVRTDENGEFDFPELEYGTYTVYTEIVGIVTIPFQVTISEENPSSNVNIVVRNGEAILGIDYNQSAFIESVVNIYPNPVITSATIELNIKENSHINTEVYNQFGQLVSETSHSLSIGMHEISIDLSDLNKGMYLLRISAEDNIAIVRKFIKTR